MSKTLPQKILHTQLKEAHMYVLQTLDGVTDEVAAFQPEGRANPIAGTFAHLVFSEDFFIHTLIQGEVPLFDTTWKDKTGASELQPTEWESAYPAWLRTVTVNMEAFTTYANAVFAASEAYVEQCSDKELERSVDMSMFGMGERAVHSILGGMVIGHARDIMGEISVLKGIQNLKGYPF